MTMRLRVVLSAVAVLAWSCGGPHVITQDLSEPLPRASQCEIGEIRDALPQDVDSSDHPDPAHLIMLKGFLQDQLMKEKVFDVASVVLPGSDYVVTGSILDFKRGSGVVRFLGLFGAGNAHVTVALELRQKQTGNVVFSGNFKQVVTSYAESGDKTFERVAQDLARTLRKRRDALKLTGAPSTGVAPESLTQPGPVGGP